MEFHNQVFVTKGLRDRREEIIQDIQSGDMKSRVYLITIPPNNHQLELFYLGLGQQPGFVIDDHKIIGLAQNYSDGLELIRKISELVYNNTGDLNYKSYFML